MGERQVAIFSRLGPERIRQHPARGETVHRELVARVRRAGATGALTVRVDSGFWSTDTIVTLNRLDVRYTMAVRCSTTGIADAIATMCQLRQPHSEGRAYFDRRVAEGKTTKEAIRALKRQLSNTVYRHLVADTRRN